jgi:hypothetical protein
MLSFAAAPHDAVALRPAWPALLSSLRFARHTWWRFGNATSVLRCVERGERRWLTERRPGDPLRLRFDLQRWSRAFARSTGTAREIGIIADDGSPIASIHLEAVDPALDELIWRLIDDSPPPPLAGRTQPSRTEALTLAGVLIARRLAPTALPFALQRAQAAGLPLRLRVENAGGGVTWTPRAADVEIAAGRIVLRSDEVDVAMPADGVGVWAVASESAEACCPTIECCTPDDRGSIRLDVTADSATTCTAWRRICATLDEE